MKKSEITIILTIALIFIIPFISAGIFGNAWDKITGKATSANVLLNISVTNGPPTIYNITGLSAITLIDGPSPTFVTINFSVNDSDGAANLNNATAMINLTRAGQAVRYNSSCAVKNFAGGNFANYTCNITLWWFDQTGPWTIYANITDLNGNTHVNGTHTITVNTLTGFVMSPPALAFANLVAGAYNQTPTNHLTMNNTGNVNITTGNIQMNATDLVGETTPSTFIWAGNFSASPYTGGNIECNITASATQMVNKTFTGIANSVMAAGNYSLNDGTTGQEKIYLCLRQVGVELSQQQYSTARNGAWTVQIV
jgi:hypothetical protein